jgi:hypothetical protein
VPEGARAPHDRLEALRATCLAHRLAHNHRFAGLLCGLENRFRPDWSDEGSNPSPSVLWFVPSAQLESRAPWLRPHKRLLRHISDALSARR